MSDSDDRHTLSVQIANQFINTANSRLEEGLNPMDIAAGMRHAAANFSAFALAGTMKPEDIDPAPAVEEFVNMFSYYLERHAETQKPASGLDALVQQVRDET